jgi:ElaB/YqjD/DUF883 family membrane-anchored ribosome-binding protein
MMAGSDRTEELLTEIRDLLAGHEQRYAEYLARFEELDKSQAARTREYIKQAHWSRLGVLAVALVIGILLWVFMLYVIIRVQ